MLSETPESQLVKNIFHQVTAATVLHSSSFGISIKGRMALNPGEKSL